MNQTGAALLLFAVVEKMRFILATSVATAVLLVATRVETVVAGFGCTAGVGSSVLSCICAENQNFTSTLCNYFHKAYNNSEDTALITQLGDPSAVITLFAVNNSAYEITSSSKSLTEAELQAYESNLALSLEYLAVNGTAYNQTSLVNKGSSYPLTTLANGQLLLVTNTNNVTTFNDDSDCVLDSCSATGLKGSASVCLVSCVLAPSDGLGTIAIIGIVVAGVAAACLVVACVFNIFRKDPEDEHDGGDDVYQPAGE